MGTPAALFGRGGRDEGGERFGCEEPVRHRQRGAGQEGRVRQSPGQHVELRHDREDPVTGRQAERVGKGDAHRVQVDRPVAVDHTLGVAGRPRRVAHRGGLPLVGVRPGVAVRPTGHQFRIVVHRDPYAVEQAVVRWPVDHDVLDGLHRGQHRRERRQQRGVDDDHPVLGVVGDVDNLVAAEPDVQRVDDGAHARHREVGLDMLLVVPHEGGNPVPVLDAERGQRVRQPGDVPAGLGVRRLPEPVGHGGDEPAGAAEGGAVLEDPPELEWDVLHGAAHHRSPRFGQLDGW